MMKITKTIAILLALIFALGIAGCDGKSNVPGDNQTSTAESGANAGVPDLSEDNFVWEDNTITALSDRGAKKTSIIIPARCDKLEGSIFFAKENKVIEVSFESDKDIDLNGAFQYAEGLKRISLPAQLTEIGEMEFYNCEALESIDIPETVTKLGEYTFKDAKALKSVVFQGSLISEIPAHAFDGCKALQTIELPKSITTIGEYSFNKCSVMQTIELPEIITTIGKYAFYGCLAMESVELPKALIEVDAFAFGNNGLTEIQVPESMTLNTYDVTSFVQADHDVVIFVFRNSWADQNFDSVFDGAFEKKYIGE
jgi:hypothetical protein